MDADSDGLEDYCEEIIAPAFAPELYYYNQDDVRREPHWAARPNGNTVFIAYLLSYYYDVGATQFYYPCTLPEAPDSCRGHNGDSEDIYLVVYYNSTTQHWILGQAYYSHHGSYGIYSQGSHQYPTQLYYPSNEGAYPRAYVSEGKHANYSNVSECNAGGTLFSDTCNEDNSAARVEMYGATGSLNIGSSAHHSANQDCMPSANPSFEYYGSGRLECYWTNQRFRGWIPTYVGGDDSDPYSPKLAALSF